MTGKVSIEGTIAEAYRFAFVRFVSVLGTMWLPYLVFLLLVAGLVFVSAPELPRLLEEQDIDVPSLMILGRLALLTGVVGFIVSAMVSVGLQRLALGFETRPVYVFFSLGRPVWRMAGALFLSILVIFILAMITTAVGIAVWFAAGSLGGAMWLVRVLVVAAGACFLIYVALRLLFFLPAVVVAEETLGIERAWILGGHNFWRILIVAIAVFVPIAIAFHLLSWAIFGPSVSLPTGHLGTRALLRTLFLQFGALGIFGLLFQIVERIILLGVLNGAVGKAYLAVTGKDAAPSAAETAA